MASRSCSTDSTYKHGKSSWPELVGTRGEEAVAIIMKENSSVRAYTMNLYNSFISQQLCHDRVRVFIDQQGLVAVPPKIE